MLKKAKEDLMLLIHSRKHIFIFELTYKLAATAVVYPLAVLVLDMVFRFAGINYLTNEYILKAATNPAVILTMLVILFIFVLYCMYEMSFLASCFELKRRECNASVIDTSLTALKHIRPLFDLKNIPLAVFVFIMIAAVNFAVCGNLVYSQTVVNLFKIYVINNKWFVKAGLFAVVFLIYMLVIPGIYSFPIFILEKADFRAAYKKSAAIVKKHFFGTVMSLIAYNICIIAVIAILYVIISIVLIAGVKLLAMAYMGSAIYLSVLRIVRTGIKVGLLFIAIPVSYTVITRMYYRYNTELIDFDAVYMQKRYLHLNRMIYFTVLVLSVVLNVVYVAASFNRNPFDKIAVFHETKITAHRGSSIEAPENTMAAFKKALDDMSDYIELDVQLTADDEVVVMHDASAYRTTGVDKKISEMTLEEVKKLDAGSYHSKEFAGEQVPTLEEVLQFADGKVLLNIELKTTSSSVKLVEKVIELIKAYDMENSCVITSFDYYALKYAKHYDTKIQTGYILSVAYGDYFNMPDIDFFSMNASFLSKRTVDAIHQSGKQIFAWTVNNETSVKNLTNKGVDNIITDNPVVARETIYSRDTSETLINMIKYVFNG